MTRRASHLIRRAAALLLAVALLPLAAAESPDPDTVISGLQQTLDTTTDASFLVTGELLGGDGTVYRLELEVEAMPQEQLLRIFIIQPDALADNFIIVTPEDLYNYNYLTNQVVLYRADDPNAYGPLAGDAEGSFQLTLDLAELFSGWDATVSGEVTTPLGAAVQLELSNSDRDANIAAATVTALEGDWWPQEIELFTAAGDTLLRIELSEVQTDTGLSEDDLLWYPPDAELIDER